MNNKLRKSIIGAGVVLIGGFASYLSISYANLETYTFNRDTQLLTDSKGIEYENLHDDFLNYDAINPTKKIGKIDPNGAVYEIEGQEDHDWIYMDDGAEMGIQEVRIRKGLEAIPLEELKPKRVEIVNNTGFHKSMGSSIKKDIRDEMMAALIEGKPQILRNIEGEQYRLWLEDPRMKGIAYVAAILLTKDHQHVYVAKNNLNVWHEVTGPAKQWVIDIVS